jgi:histidine triad (HIT) family protein
MDDCIFCRIIKERQEHDTVIFEDDVVIALISLHQKPGNVGHALLLPKAHVKNIYELPEELDTALMAGLRTLATASKSAFLADGIQIRQNNEPAAGQDVFHLHFHIIPRFANDDFESVLYERFSIQKRTGTCPHFCGRGG